MKGSYIMIVLLKKIRIIIPYTALLIGNFLFSVNLCQAANSTAVSKHSNLANSEEVFNEKNLTYDDIKQKAQEKNKEWLLKVAKGPTDIMSTYKARMFVTEGYANGTYGFKKSIKELEALSKLGWERAKYQLKNLPAK